MQWCRNALLRLFVKIASLYFKLLQHVHASDVISPNHLHLITEGNTFSLYGNILRIYCCLWIWMFMNLSATLQCSKKGHRLVLDQLCFILLFIFFLQICLTLISYGWENKKIHTKTQFRIDSFLYIKSLSILTQKVITKSLWKLNIWMSK